MKTAPTKTRITSFAPQFLVEDLDRSIAYYEKLGFEFGEPWGGFYAIGRRDGLELHVKVPPKGEHPRANDRERLDAAAGVDGIEKFYDECVASGSKILKPLTPTDWGTKDFYIEDPDGNVISFGGIAAEKNIR